MTLVSEADVSAGAADESPFNPTTSGHGRWLIFVVAFVILSIGVPVTLIAQVGDTARTDAWQLALVLTAWCGMRLALLIAGGEARFFAFFVWLFTYIFMGVAPAVQIRSNQPSLSTPDILPSSDFTAMWIVILGIVCFEIGTFAAWVTRRRAPAADREPPAQPAPRGTRPPHGVRPLITLLMAAAGLAISVYYISQVGSALFVSRDAAAAARARIWVDPPTRAVVGALAVYPLLIAIGGLVQLRRSTPGLPTRLVYAGLALLGSAVLLVAVNPISSARYTLGTVVFALVVIFGAATTQSRVRLSMAGLVLGLFLVFPLADAFRVGVADFSRAGFFGEYAANPDYDSFWQVANAFTYWRSGIESPGFQALGLVAFWVPRSLWPGKPLDTGVVLGIFNGYGLTNLSAPLWAEAIVNGGIVVMVGVFLVLGFVLRRLDDRVIKALAVSRGGGAPGVWLIVGAVFPVYFMILMRGSLLQATGAILVIIGCLLLIRRPRRLRARAGQLMEE